MITYFFENKVSALEKRNNQTKQHNLSIPPKKVIRDPLERVVLQSPATLCCEIEVQAMLGCKERST